MLRLAPFACVLLLGACARGTTSEPCHVVNTSAAGAKTGASTAVKGVEQFGSATVGLVEGGSDEAKARWKKGGQDTKATAREGAGET